MANKKLDPEITTQDARELAWWRHFATKIKPGGDMPKVGSAFYGERYDLIRDKRYDG